MKIPATWTKNSIDKNHKKVIKQYIRLNNDIIGNNRNRIEHIAVYITIFKHSILFWLQNSKYHLFKLLLLFLFKQFSCLLHAFMLLTSSKQQFTSSLFELFINKWLSSSEPRGVRLCLSYTYLTINHITFLLSYA